jgi:hypothetical protein
VSLFWTGHCAKPSRQYPLICSSLQAYEETEFPVIRFREFFCNLPKVTATTMLKWDTSCLISDPNLAVTLLPPRRGNNWRWQFWLCFGVLFYLFFLKKLDLFIATSMSICSTTPLISHSILQSTTSDLWGSGIFSAYSLVPWDFMSCCPFWGH